MVYFGSLLRTLGVFFMLCERERRVWLRIRPGLRAAGDVGGQAHDVSRRNRLAHAGARRAGEVIGDTVLEPALNQPAPLFMEMLNKPFDKLRTNVKLSIPFAVSPSTTLMTGLMKNHASAVEGHERIQLVKRSLKHLPWFSSLFAVGQNQGSL